MKESRYNFWTHHQGHHWVYNGISGSLLAIPDGEWPAIRAFIAGRDDGAPSATLLQQLVVGRMLITDDHDEVAFLQRRYRASQSDTESFGLTIVTSLGCNFDCPYCFEVKPSVVLSEETQQLILKMVDAQLPTIKHLSVTWYGGEPLMGQPALFQLSDAFIARADATGVEYDAEIITNGYLLTPALATALRNRRVRSAQVTLDGPPGVHDLMRPLRSGRPTFDVILRNIQQVADILNVSIRVNIDTSNVASYQDLLQLLADSGLAGRVTVYPGKIVTPNEGTGAPSETYAPPCLTMSQFAHVERDFARAAIALGLDVPAIPTPVGAPCTAVRPNECVIGAGGELYKCWDSVGNHREVIGHMSSWGDRNDRALKWLAYDPFEDEECRSCPALPVCMGGCAHHAMDEKLRDSRCSTFRFTHDEQVREYVSSAATGTVESRLIHLGGRPTPLV